MAKNNEQAREGGFAERSLRFLRNFHIALGGVALTGAVIFPGPALFPTVAAYEGVNALAHEELRKRVARKKK